MAEFDAVIFGRELSVNRVIRGDSAVGPCGHRLPHHHLYVDQAGFVRHKVSGNEGIH